jgi:hypothetical protein
LQKTDAAFRLFPPTVRSGVVHRVVRMATYLRPIPFDFRNLGLMGSLSIQIVSGDSACAGIAAAPAAVVGF